MNKVEFLTWGNMRSLELEEPTYIMSRLVRGEVGMLQAITNAGKTTLALNASICLAVGRPMEPLVSKGSPKRILYLDYETPLEVMRDDLLTMETILTDDEKKLLEKNLIVYSMANRDSNELWLNRPPDRQLLAAKAKEIGADLIIIDPIALAFTGINEQDNSEVTEKIFHPLQKLAKESGGASVLFTHHIGKQKSEEGQSAQPAYKSRGASSFGTLSRFILDIDQKGGDLPHTILSFPKVKGPKVSACEMTMDIETRWFTLTQLETNEEDNSIEKVLRVLRENGGTATRAEILATSGLSRGTLDRWLKFGVERGKLVKDSDGRGSYGLAGG